MRCLGLTGNNERSAGSEKNSGLPCLWTWASSGTESTSIQAQKAPHGQGGVSHGAQVQPSERGDVLRLREESQRASLCYRVGAGLRRDQERSSGPPTSPRSPSSRLMASRDGLGAEWQAGHQLRTVKRNTKHAGPGRGLRTCAGASRTCNIAFLPNRRLLLTCVINACYPVYSPMSDWGHSI